MEPFNATCRPGHVLLIEAARYGRMNIGRCVRGSYGYLGCAADARRFMDGRCSGRRHCHFVVPDPVLYAMQPCPGDFTSYLETTYSCVEGQMSAVLSQ
jgi:Galactose binding lectin domain